MSYSVKEIFYTLQGEGANVGRPAVFCRFAGCNLWSGREEDRNSGPGGCSSWCDTDFVGTDGTNGGRFLTSRDLAQAVATQWPSNLSRPFVVCTGGEPLLQMDDCLISEFHRLGFEIAIETNGTRIPPTGIDWICVSPKMGADLVLRKGSELKLVVPQEGLDPKEFEDLEFDYFSLQPMDGPEKQRNTCFAVDYCLRHPQWRLSVQTHKFLGIR
jgi:7-carboxy-7-deazaguanine synthase